MSSEWPSPQLHALLPSETHRNTRGKCQNQFYHNSAKQSTAESNWANAESRKKKKWLQNSRNVLWWSYLTLVHLPPAMRWFQSTSNPHCQRGAFLCEPGRIRVDFSSKQACVCVCVWTPNLYSLSKFRVPNTVLSTVVTMLYIWSLELVHLIESLYPLSHLSHFPHPSLPYSF